MPNTLIITPDRNTHSNDYTGAFHPESQTFIQVVPGQHKLIQIDVSKGMPVRMRQLFAELEACSNSFSAVAFFCHGWADGIQVGVRRTNIPELVRLLCKVTKNGTDAKNVLHVPLYCCSTAAATDTPEGASETGGDGGFADLLRDSFCAQGKPWIRVYAHTTKGHTTMNPQVRVFEGKGSTVGMAGGEALVRQPPPKNALWPLWRDALTCRPPFDKGTMTAPQAFVAGTRGTASPMERRYLRFAAPFMTIAELHGVLAPDGVV